ncbi:MAG: hypothetical protein Q9227_002734 [Pyrenula ochraceoflavens]
MGKKDHPPRGSGKQKKPPPTIPDSDHVVFTNSKDRPKNPSKKAPDKPQGSKDVPESSANQQPKKPDVRTLIGGNASWTGKLPVTLLNEHCQKQKWERPEYSMRPSGSGFESWVTLRSKNPKTQEMTILPPFRLPSAHKSLAIQPSALEARHFAAAYTLYRISNMKNIHMMLPPAYRDLWKGEFANLKDEDVKIGRGWIYEADPFAAQQAQESIKAEREKKAESDRKAAEVAKSADVSQLTISGPGSKAWQRGPTAELGSRLRTEIEDIVRRQAVWNPDKVLLTNAQKGAIVNELSSAGFRRSHVEEAVDYCKDKDEALEWLLIHVPEDDLPQWSFPEGYSTGVTFASGDLVKESKIKTLAEAGYSADLCERALTETKGNTRKAACLLQAALMHQAYDFLEEDEPDSIDEWKGEMMAFEAIFGDQFAKTSPTSCSLTVNFESIGLLAELKFFLPYKLYPMHPPVMFILSKQLPAQIRLSAIRRALDFARETLLGAPMMFNMLEYLESHIEEITLRPGPLRFVMPEAVSVLKDNSAQNSQPSFTPRQQRLRALGKAGDSRSTQLQETWASRQNTSQQQKMLSARQALPAWTVRESVIKTISQHQVTIVSGATGSGKSTQCVQFVLDNAISKTSGSTVNILCTQPRRISALGLADRVSAERCSTVGNEVGYVIRGDSKMSFEQTRITFMTTGVLLRRLQSFDKMADSLSNVSHVFVDEVHERSLDNDILLALLKDVLQTRPSLKIVMMSATLDADTFISYFHGVGKVGQVDIEGRTFPITDVFLDDILRRTNFNNNTLSDGQEEMGMGRQIQNLGFGIHYDLIVSLVQYIDEELGQEVGSILIFLPGVLEIERCLAALQKFPRVFGLPLHASLAPTEQRKVFERVPPGRRKVIAATNVAETSITIEDTVAVIDSGRVKETMYDVQGGMVRLEEVWASQAACTQRRGRAGRVRAGTCYKLFTRKVQSEMRPRPEPEIRRVPLEQLCLSVKATGTERDIAAFLRQTLTPPESGAVDQAVNILHRVGALDNTQNLTSLGRYLAMIPADLRLAKLLVLGSIFGCLEPCLVIAAILTTKSPFVSPREQRDMADLTRASFDPDRRGDPLLSLSAYYEWSDRLSDTGPRATRTWASSMFLNYNTLQEISSTRAQLLTALQDTGLVSLTYSPSNSNATLNANATSIALLRSLIGGSLSPNTARIVLPDKKYAQSISGAVELDPEARTIKYFAQDPSQTLSDGKSNIGSGGGETRVFIHPSSTTIFSAQSFPGHAVFMSYFSKMATSKVFIRDLTPFNLYGLLLFGGGEIELDTMGRGVVADGWIRIRCWARIGVLVRRLRRSLDEVLRRKLEGGEGEDGEEVGRLLDVVRRLVEKNGQDR